jgi:hypothetical protein
MVALYGSMKRRLYARIPTGRQDEIAQDSVLPRARHAAWMSNAIAFELQGLIDSTCELIMAEHECLRNDVRQL